VFSWSYRALSRDAARLFRLLGLHAGPDCSITAAASLAATTPDRARAALAELTRVHLLAEPSPARHAFHDLLRAYAAEQAQAHDSDADRDAALHRVLDHYLHTACRAAMLIEPFLEPLMLDPPQPGVTPDELSTDAEAMAWFTAEHGALLAAVQLAADAGYGTHAWQLASTLSTWFLRRGSWADNARAHGAALAAARQIGDRAGEAHALFGLGNGNARSGRFREAGSQFSQALRQFEAIGDRIGQAAVHACLTWICERHGRLTEALGHAERAFELYQAEGRQPGQAMLLNDIGYCHARLGDFQRAITYCEQALDALREIGERNWEAATWDSLGYIYDQLGSHQRSLSCYERAVDLYRELADRFNEADSLHHLGDAQRAAGDTEAARRSWLHSLRIYDEIDHPDGDQVRAKLDLAAARRPGQAAAPGAVAAGRTRPAAIGR
jgi:tetratricopeptide (TPR) repeat protein